MDNKRKEKLLKTYFEIAEAEHLYHSIDDYQVDIRETSEKHINDIFSEEDRIRMWTKLLDRSNKAVYLGMMEALKTDDYAYLDKALNTYIRVKLLTVMQSGYDHCISLWNIVPILFALKRFDAIETVFPKECGISKNGMTFLKAATNLIMYLYYREESWKEQVLKETDKFLNQKNPLEFQSFVSALYALLNEDFEQLSLEISNVCKGRKKSKQYGENKFSKEFSFSSLGLYNFAEYLYPNEVDKIILPDDENFLTDYFLYQKNTSYFEDSYIIEFTKSLSTLNKMFSVETPAVTLMKNGRNYEIDYKAYNDELVKRVMEAK